MSAGRFTVYGSATTLRDDFPGAAALFAECFTRPTFPAGGVRQGAAARPGGHRPPGRRSAPGNQRVLLPTTCRPARPTTSSRAARPTSVRKLTAEDLRQYHAKYFVPNNMVVTVFGDIDPDEALALVKKLFGGLKPAPDFQPLSFDRQQRHRQDDRASQDDRQADGHGVVRLSHGEHSREGRLRRDDGAGGGHGGLPLSGRMAAQRAARRGAGLLRPRLSR